MIVHKYCSYCSKKDIDEALMVGLLMRTRIEVLHWIEVVVLQVQYILN